MSNNHQWVQEHFSSCISYACSVLTLNQSEIRKAFPDHTIYSVECIEKDIREHSLEIRLEKEQTTLTCLFNENGKCDYSFLFIDNFDEAKASVLHLNNTFDYDFLLAGWILSNCYVEIKRDKGEILGFMFYQPFEES